MNVPVVILGNATERPEGLETGASVLVGTKPDNIYTKVYDLLTNPVVYKEMSNAINPYGNGNASEKIIRIILKYLGIWKQSSKLGHTGNTTKNRRVTIIMEKEKMFP